MEERIDPLRGALRDLRRLLVGPDYPLPPRTAPPSRWQRWQTYLIPVYLVALLGLTMLAAEYLIDNRDLHQWVVAVLAIGSTLPVALVTRRPLLAWRIAHLMLYLGVIRVGKAEPWAWNPVQIIGFLFVLIVLAARAGAGVSAWAGALSLVPVYLFVPTLANAYGVTVLIAALLLVGDQVRRRRQSQRALVEQAERSERERARRAVLEERTRIAREMHDVVAHHMSMIAVQAETAPYRLAGLPDPVRAEFGAIADSARVALTDMRRLLGVLRSESTSPETAPQPGLADVPELVAAASRAGMSVTLAAETNPAPEAIAPEAVELAAYRIIQEALANAARHAPGAPVRVWVRSDDGGLTVTVSNSATDSARPGSERAATMGHGLTGMRERARLLGGTFTAGPTENGYAVRAHLPYEPEDGG